MPVILDILNQLTFAVIVVNQASKITFINYAAESLLGHSKDFVVGHSFNECFEHSPIHEEEFLDILESYQSVILREVQLKPVGQNETIRANVALTPLDTGEILLEVERVDRILQISKEDQIYSSQVASNALLRALAHEIRNPLGGIRGAAQLLEHELDSEDLKEFTQVIIAESDRLRTLVDRLLGPSQHKNQESFNIHQVIERVLKLSSLDDRSKKIDLTIQRNYDPSLPELLGDSDHVLQAILNIVTNALDALSETTDPKLIVKTSIVHHFTIGKFRNPSCIEVQLENNGPMIPLELQNQIFLPLITSKTRGSGLGLAIAQNVAQAHGGLITCESEPTYTRFKIYLPVRNDG